jgi:hypothetical protein
MCSLPLTVNHGEGDLAGQEVWHMWWTWEMHKNLNQKIWDHLGCIGIDWRTVLKWILKKLSVNMGTEFIWFRIRSCARLFWPSWTVRSHKSQEIFWPDEQLLVSQLSFMELVMNDHGEEVLSTFLEVWVEGASRIIVPVCSHLMSEWHCPLWLPSVQCCSPRGQCVQLNAIHLICQMLWYCC